MTVILGFVFFFWAIFCGDAVGSSEERTRGLASDHCDSVYFPRAGGMPKDVGNGNSAVLITSGRPAGYSRPWSGRVGCQKIILLTNGTIGDLVQVDRFVWRHRIASSAVVFTSSVSPEFIGLLKKRWTFALSVYQNDQTHFSINEAGAKPLTRYLPAKDPSWKFVKATYLVLSPYVLPPKKNGTLDGSDIVIWDILREKHGLRIDSILSRSFNELYSRVSLPHD